MGRTHEKGVNSTNAPILHEHWNRNGWCPRIVGVRGLQGHSMGAVDHAAINWRLLTPQSFFEVFDKLPQFFHHGTTIELAPKLVEDGIHPGGDCGTRKVVMLSASETFSA